MRLLQKYMAFFALIALLVTSCSKDETATVNGDVADNAASIYFGPVLADLGSQFNRQQEQDIPECSTDDPAYAQITLTYGEANTEVSVVVEILQDDQGLFTAYDDELEIPIPSGETTVSVTLTDFVVWNDVDGAPGMPIWVAPKEGSEYAQFVSDPLSNTFSLRAGSKNYVNVDVICFDDRDVNLYGYQFFDINPVPLYEFCVFANYCTDAGRHYTADYTFALYEYDGNREDGKGDMIYSSLSPETGMDDGTYWADPLCVTIPGPGDLASDVPYLVFEATLSDWPGYYTAEDDDESVITKTISWDMIQMLFDEDGNDETTEYYHIFFNCADDDGPVECDLNDPDADCDNDGIPNGEDNCPQVSNQDQADLDGDDIGDVCDEDRDGDGTDNDSDPCPDDPNDDCVDDCADRGGDSDSDGVCDDDDNCPQISNPDQADLDGDNIGDVCDEDRDGDGTDNDSDPCPDDPNDDCVDDCADRGGDSDSDGVCDDDDNCPNVANPDQADLDGDNIGDACDEDRDGDGVDNGSDPCPDDPNDNCVDECANSGGDTDGDGICDDDDNCPSVANADQADFDQDGIGDVCDPDIDNDGVPNDQDDCDFEVPVVDEDGDGCEDEPTETCEIGSADAGCGKFYLSGTNGFVEITQPAGEFPDPYGLIPIGGTFEDRIGTITIQLSESLNPVITVILNEGYSADDYIIEVRDESGSDITCVAETNVDPPTGDSPDIFEDFSNTADYDYSFFVRVEVNACD